MFHVQPSPSIREYGSMDLLDQSADIARGYPQPSICVAYFIPPSLVHNMTDTRIASPPRKFDRFFRTWSVRAPSLLTAVERSVRSPDH